MTLTQTDNSIALGSRSAAQILFDLVSTPSVSGDEHAAAKVFVEHAVTLGFDAHVDEVNNAIAHRGPADAGIHIVLLGHIDTVPGDIPVRIEDGVLYGRGSVDAKGPLTAMLVAASQTLLPDGVRITVAGAAGEEASGSVGARFIVDQWSPDACLIGEPSGFVGVTLGYKGRLLVNTLATCENSHSAGQDSSACDLLHDWWAAVKELIDSFNTDHTRVFDQIQATIHGISSSCDGLHQSANMQAGFRLPLGVDPTGLAEQLQALAPAGITMEFEGGELAYATDRNDPVVRALSTSIRTHGHTPRPKLKTGTADFNVVGPVWKCPIAAYGPGDSALDHTPNEHLDLEELDQSVAILKTALESLATGLLG